MRGIIPLLFVLAFGGTLARSGVLDNISTPRVDGSALSPEEIRLIRDFRHSPEPYRRLLREQVPVRGERDQDRGDPLSESVVGSRDVVDVVISGGQVAFWGKRKDYERVGFLPLLANRAAPFPSATGPPHVPERQLRRGLR